MANPFLNFNNSPANTATATTTAKRVPLIDFSKFGLQNKAKPEPVSKPESKPEVKVPTAVQEPENELEVLEPLTEETTDELFDPPVEDNESELVGLDLNPVVVDPADESSIEDPAVTQAEQEAKAEKEESETTPKKVATKNKLQASDTEIVKPTKKVTRRKKVEKSEEKTEAKQEKSSDNSKAVEAESESAEIIVEDQAKAIDMSTLLESKYTVDEMIEKVMSKFTDAKFEAFRKDISARLGKIRITEDMPPGAIRYLLQDLDCLSGDLFQLKVDIKTMYAAVTEKIGIFAANVALNAPGKTVAERERNRPLAFLNANFYNENVNLLPVIESVRYRKIFLEEVSAYMEEKRHAIYSALANNKTEADLAKLSD